MEEGLSINLFIVIQQVLFAKRTFSFVNRKDVSSFFDQKEPFQLSKSDMKYVVGLVRSLRI